MKKRYAMFLVFLLPGIARAQISQQGPNDPQYFIEELFGCLACPGSNWMNLSDAAYPDGSFATAQLMAQGTCFQSSCYYARAIYAEDFGYLLPPTALITGIKAEVLRLSSASQSVQDTIVQLIVGGTPMGANKALAGYWPVTPSYAVYGDSTDLWGLSLSALQVANSDFGVAVKPVNRDTGLAGVSAAIDHIRITVYYHYAAGLPGIYGANPVRIFSRKEQLIVDGLDPSRRGNIVLCDMEGRMLVDVPVSSGRQIISLPRIAFGLYVVTIRQGDALLRKKVRLTSE
jgi:hypothetical protein